MTSRVNEQRALATLYQYWSAEMSAAARREMELGAISRTPNLQERAADHAAIARELMAA